MGSATACELARHSNAKVALLEQFDFLHTRGSSHGHSRIIRRTYPEPHYAAMMYKSYELWAEIEKIARVNLVTQTGGLDISPVGNKEMESLITSCRALGIKHERLTEADVRQRFPEVDLPQGYDAVYSSEGGMVNAAKALATFQSVAREHGAVLMDRTKVNSLAMDKSAKDQTGGGELLRIETDNGTLLAHRVVLCPGPWAAALFQRLFQVQVPIVPVKITVPYWRILAHDQERSEDGGGDSARYLYTPPKMTNGSSGNSGSKDSSDDSNPDCFPVLIRYGTNTPGDPDMYALPSPEYPGYFKLCLHLGPVCDDASARDYEPDWPSIRKYLVPLVSPAESPIASGEESDIAKLGNHDGEQTRRVHSRTNILRGLADWPSFCETCTYSNTPDHDFIIDYLRSHSSSSTSSATSSAIPAGLAGRVVVGAGFSGHGFKFAPVVGMLLARMALADGAVGGVHRSGYGARTKVHADFEPDMTYFRMDRPALLSSTSTNHSTGTSSAACVSGTGTGTKSRL
jgi:sarcosine oxidase/L-pipecolate oxidase